MEAPTRKEVVEKMEWSLSDATSRGLDYYLNGKYEWEDQEWNPTIRVLSDGQSFELELKQRAGHREQSRTLEEAVRNCASAILLEIEEHVRKYEKEQEEKRKLDEHRRKGQEWADKANSVTIED